jgi:hypothetical protein
MAVLFELLLLFAAAAFMGLRLYWLAAPMLCVILWRGWRSVSGRAQREGWLETILAFAIPASAILCVRALGNGHWF